MARIPTVEQLQGIIDAAHNELDAWRIPKSDEATGYTLTLTGRIVVGLSELVTTRQQRDAAIAALEAVEWSGNCCPSCTRFKSEGHSDYCQLAAALAKARG